MICPEGDNKDLIMRCLDEKARTDFTMEADTPSLAQSGFVGYRNDNLQQMLAVLKLQFLGDGPSPDLSQGL